MTVVSSVTEVFSAISDWIVEAIQSVLPIFYSSTEGLTLLGTLAVITLGFGIFFLILGVITNFFQFRA